MRLEPRGAYLHPVTGYPLILKRSIRGLQFFAHMPGQGAANPQPMSELHMVTQIELVRGLRAAGLFASVEKPGCTPQGEDWQADVYCEIGGRRIAFEAQLASQTLEVYEGRTARYERSGVECVWLVRSPGRYAALGKAIWHRLLQDEPADLLFGRRPFLPHLRPFPLLAPDPKVPRAQDISVSVFPVARGPARRVSLQEFAVGVARGKLYFADNQWLWSTQVP